MKKFSKSVLGLSAAVVLLCLGGCGNAAAENYDCTTILIEKDGSVRGVEVDTFDQTLYDQNELKEMTDEAVRDYNASDKGKVSLEKLEQSGNQVKMVMHYDSTEDYVDFNTPVTHSKVLFYGTLEAAQNAGYSISDLISVSDGTAVEKEQLDGMKDKMVVITSEAVHICVPQKIMYVSQGVTVSDNKNEADLTASDTGLFIIVMK